MEIIDTLLEEFLPVIKLYVVGEILGIVFAIVVTIIVIVSVIISLFRR